MKQLETARIVSSQEMINKWERKQEINFFMEEFSHKYTSESTRQLRFNAIVDLIINSEIFVGERSVDLWKNDKM